MNSIVSKLKDGVPVLKSLIPDYATRLSGSYAPSADELFEMLSDNEDLSDIYGVDGESQ